MNSHHRSLTEFNPRIPARPMPAPDYSPGYAPESDDPAFDPLQLLSYAIKHRWVIATLLLCGLIGGVVYTWMQTPVYRASTTVEIITGGARTLNEIDVFETLNDARTLETQRTKLLSRDLARRAVFELGLADNADFIAPQASFSLGNLVNRALRRNTSGGNIESLTAEQRQSIAIGRLLGGLSADFVRGTAILRIGFAHPNRELTALVVNQVATSFIDQAADQRGATSELTRQFIEEQVAETKSQLEASERSLVEYAEAEGIILNNDENSLLATSISAVNTALSELTQELFIVDQQVEQIEGGNARTLPQVVESGAVQSAQERLAELRATYQQKLATLKPAFPEMQQLGAQIRETEAQIQISINSVAQSVRLRAEQLVQRRGTLQAELADLEAQQAEFQRKNVRYTILKREVDSNRAQYESLIGKLNEVGVGSDLRRANASVIDTALSGARISPSLSKNVTAALAIAIILAALAIYILELLNNTFSNPDQIEADLKLPVLGIIPATKPEDIEEQSADPMSAYSEAYRTLRTSLEFSGADQPAVTIAVTSAEASEGKSSTVFKLANEFAGLGKRVLVIDADMRKSKMHRFFKTDNAIGLSNLLTNVVKSSVETPVFRKTKIPKLEFISAGILPPNPANLLASQRMAIMMKFCAERYDIVLIDCPPVVGLADALILTRMTDATLLVVSTKQVKRSSVKSAVKRLRSASANIVGAAMTKFEVDRFDYNYAYKYMKYDYYTYGNDTSGNTSNAGRKTDVFGIQVDNIRRLLGSRSSTDG
ncbi:MAG: polysaccharide biosynthesis tyrosine autokinase [Pseudomonadota bacterium]